MRLRRKKLQEITLSLCCLLPALLLTGCSLFGGGPPKAGKAPAAGQVYTSPLIFLNGNTDLTTLDPALAYDQNSLTAISLIYTGLVSLDDHMQVQPQLASSWEQSTDGRSWTFHLRPNLKFSDGTPLTASDVAYSIDRALQPATKSTIAPIYLGIIQDADKLLGGGISTLLNDSLQVVDQRTLKILTQKPAPYFLDMLAKNCSFVVEQQLIKQYNNNFALLLTRGGGAGPFAVSQYVPGQRITFAPNPDYYGPRPQLRQVVLPFYTRQAAAYNDYAAGKVDSADVPLATLPAISRRSDFHQVPQLWINYYTMNYRVPPFDNLHIRQAFALALNKSTLARDVWKNTVIPTNHIIPQGMPGYNPNLTGPDATRTLTGNPAAAQALLRRGLQEEHWSSVSQIPPIKLTYATGLSSFDQEVQGLITMWQKVLGIVVTPDPVDSNTLLDEVSAATGNTQGLQMWGLSWVAEYPDPQDWLTRQFGSGSVFNNMNYGQNTSSDVARQQLTQRQLLTADTDFQARARIQLYQQAEQQLVNDVAWLPVEQVTSVFLRKSYVAGMLDNGIGLVPPNAWAGIYIVQH
ncbi:MAG TPA: peptide ABC transporter substrate-binding protein [Ktedonobacteraceae bacterium]|jgi:peptide/nickel transport system substrate-binding protein/oligopeptide transport system substrate-binding protein